MIIPLGLHEAAALRNTEGLLYTGGKCMQHMGNFVGTSPADHNIQGDLLSQVTANTGSTVVP